MTVVPAAVVVDPSLAVAWVVEEVYSAPARARLLDWEQRGVRRLAPALFASEGASALLKHTRRGTIDATAAPRFLAGLLASITLSPQDGALAGRALVIAQQLGLGKAYDSLYAALAEREGCELWTGDQRFYNAAHRAFAWIHFVAEDSSSASVAIP